MRDFQNMLGNLMGPNFRLGPPGRSGHEELFPPPPMGFPLGGGAGPGVIGGRFTYTTGRLHPRNVNEPQPPPDIATYASPSPSSHRGRTPNGRSLYVVSITAPPDQLARLIGNIFGGLGPPGPPGDNEARAGVPPGLQGLFASLLNPANARVGDAVYSQEALDQIISTLMEQHPTSNAPGPASPDAIAALPKKKLDDKLLGPEGKGECSVCMDDVHIGDEVVMLPCNHWFHETCAGAWLGEHNTCPICRKGIEGDAAPASPPPNSRSSSQVGQPWSRPERLSRRLSLGSRLSRENTGSRNEARLDSIRNDGRLTPTEESSSRRWAIVGDGNDYARAPMPGSFSSPRRRDSEMSVENQRESRRGNTSGSDRSRDSRRNSGSASGGGNGGTGAMAWLRDRFSGGNDRQRRD
jgi:E3 ubiquitin-protein ligase RNF115/126